jgi:hypothetical protein
VRKIVPLLLLLSVSGPTRAIILGPPGQALLVPYVLCESGAPGEAPVFNTMISITTNDPDGQVTGPGGTVHEKNLIVAWKFFDPSSIMRLSGQFAMSPNDWHPFDWCAIRENSFGTDGVKGYIVFTDARSTPSQRGSFLMWGESYLINRDWASMAFIPVLPMTDDADQSDWTDNGPIPWSYGIQMNNQDGDPRDRRLLVLRYLLDPDFSEANELVFWFSEVCDGAWDPVVRRNQCDRRRVAYFTYDTNEQFRASGIVDLRWELNTLHLASDDPQGLDAGNDHWLASMANEMLEDAGGGDIVLKNTGLLFFHIPEGIAAGRNDTEQDRSAAVVFNLLFVSSEDNPYQVQTALAQERGFLP